MNREFFNKQYAGMVNAYTISQKMADEAQDVYWQMLNGITDSDFAEGVQECLASCKFFPTISELGEASMPAITDYRAPLPPIDHERPKLNWREQLRRREAERPQLEDPRKLLR